MTAQAILGAVQAKIAINPIVLFAKSLGTSDEEADTSQGGIQLGKKQHYNSWDNI